MVFNNKGVSIFLYVMLTVSLLSGYLYVEYVDNSLEQDFYRRAIILMCLFVSCAVSILIIDFDIRRMPIETFLFMLFFCYVVAVSILNNNFYEYVSSTLRFMIYFLFFFIALHVRNPYRALHVVVLLAAILILGQVVIDVVANRGLNINRAWRIGGSVGSAIGFAGLLYVILIMSFYFLCIKKNMLWMFFTAAITVSLFLTATRSVVGAAIVTIALVFVFSRRSWLAKLFSSILCCILVIITFIIVLRYTELGGRFDLDGIADDSSASFRLLILKTYFQNVNMSELFFGLGLGGFPDWFYDHTGKEGVAPHFEMLWLLAEGGIVGSMLFLIAFLSVVIRFFSKKYIFVSDPMLAYCAIFLFAAPQVAFQLANPLYFYQVNVLLAIILGLIYSYFLSVIRIQVSKKYEYAHN